MGIVFIKKLTGQFTLGLWKIEESMEQLLINLKLSDRDRLMLDSKKSTARKKEWLASRNLLEYMLPGHNEIVYNDNGKPFLYPHQGYISISHSGDYACAYHHPEKSVGVDVQKIKNDIGKGMDYFLNEMESAVLHVQDQVLLNIAWSSKESVFKYCGSNDLDLKKDVCIFPFERNQSGVIKVSVLHVNHQEQLLLTYELFDQYVLTRTS